MPGSAILASLRVWVKQLTIPGTHFLFWKAEDTNITPIKELLVNYNHHVLHPNSRKALGLLVSDKGQLYKMAMLGWKGSFQTAKCHHVSGSTFFHNVLRGAGVLESKGSLVTVFGKGFTPHPSQSKRPVMHVCRLKALTSPTVDMLI